MDWLDCMRSAIDYLEENLTSSISYDKASQIACCSTYHFQRMFSFIIGIPISEYVRRRRMTLAAFELQNTNDKIIDIAYRFGYESPEAFSRAFQKMHGVPPRSAGDNGVMLKAYPRLSFQINIKGGTEMDHCIEEKGSFKVFGMELKTNVVDGKCYKEIPEFWKECGENGKCEELLKKAGNDKDSLIEIPKQTWAVFPVEWHDDADDKALHEAWGRIYSEWFPTAGYEHSECDFDLEMYFGKRGGSGSVEIWIPVKKVKA